MTNVWDRAALGQDADTAHNPTPHRIAGQPTCADCARPPVSVTPEGGKGE